MALHLNLLHEEIFEQRQRQRDPLKLGMMALGAFGALLVLYYLFNAYRTLEIKSRLDAVERQWTKIEPEVTAAQKKAEDLSNTIKTTRALDDYVDARFFWAPFLQKVSRCIAPNTQLTILDGAVDEKGITVVLDGVAAGREPRAAAEDLRQMLMEQLGQTYGSVKVEFKALEDLDTIVRIGGANMAMAHYVLQMSFTATQPKASPSPGANKHDKKR